MGYIKLSCQSNGPHSIPPEIQAIDKAIGYYPQTDGKVLLSKTTLKYLAEHGEKELVFNQSFHLPLTSVHSIGRFSAHYQRRKVNTNPATNALIYNGDLLARYADAIVAEKWE